MIPGVTYLITRRCSERRFFLRPDPAVARIFEYLLGVFAAEYGVAIHAYVVMSNHYHLVLTDVRGRLPDFERDLNSMLARSINALRGRRESLWERRPYSAVELIEGRDAIAKMGYTLANPVAARLVDRACEWGGATSAGMRFGQRWQIRRPKGFFSDSMPEVVELMLTAPECCAELADDELLACVEADVRRREQESEALGPALGMQKVLEQDWRASPRTEEPLGGLRPTIACASKWARIEALRRSKEWFLAYKAALARFVAGERDAEFPRGTWWMRVGLGCRVLLE